MKAIYLIRIIAMGISLFLYSCTSAPENNAKNHTIIPLPVSISTHSGIYHLKSPVTISIPDALQPIGNLFSNYTAQLGFKTKLKNKNADISFSLNPSIILPDEGYILTINSTGVKLEAQTEAGLFYGMQTLLQLIATNGKNLPCLEITDFPRFAYRGLHLDVGRHFFPPDFIKRYIDLMARFKFNRFHWHLTEDQGWRIEIKKYPKLQEVAAWRDSTIVGHAGNSNKYDGKRYGGFYTQDEIRDIVQYAAERYITIVPEIEMPGHSRAALAAYPNLGCTGGPYTVATTWGVFDDLYCAGKDETFIFLQDVLDEVMNLFPGTYIHIGGDECPKTRWKQCRLCQQRIKKEKLKDEHELQSYFIQRIEKYLNSKGRRIIGWDEILEGGLAPNATVMSWRGEEGGIAAAKQQHQVIMTPGNWCYLDHYQASAETEPLAIGGFTPVEEVYSYEPLPDSLTETEKKFILGAQGNVWTEYMKTPEHVEYMVYPRALALAEVVWSPKEKKNYDDFLNRLQQLRPLLDRLKVNYARHVFQQPTDK
ncbi:MAG: beta-N-acetylhexosaminidase [Cyclobacteriaceae bacterium]|nr:beta-N-acetylhexosaminidase [Cyclobacteriaceae bacterium]